MVFAENESQYFEPNRLITQLQDSLENDLELAILRKSGLAVWVIGDILDTSEQLETGFEPRASLDVTFGIASNREIDLGLIETVEIQGTYNGQEDEEFTVP